MNAATAASPDALLLAKPDAAKRLGIGETTLRKLLASGEIRQVHIGRRALIPDSELQRYVRSRLGDDTSAAAKPAPATRQTP